MIELARGDAEQPYRGGDSMWRAACRHERLALQHEQAMADVPIHFERLPGEYLQSTWDEIGRGPPVVLRKSQNRRNMGLMQEWLIGVPIRQQPNAQLSGSGSRRRATAAGPARRPARSLDGADGAPIGHAPTRARSHCRSSWRRTSACAATMASARSRVRRAHSVRVGYIQPDRAQRGRPARGAYARRGRESRGSGRRPPEQQGAEISMTVSGRERGTRVKPSGGAPRQKRTKGHTRCC